MGKDTNRWQTKKLPRPHSEILSSCSVSHVRLLMIGLLYNEQLSHFLTAEEEVPRRLSARLSSRFASFVRSDILLRLSQLAVFFVSCRDRTLASAMSQFWSSPPIQTRTLLLPTRSGLSSAPNCLPCFSRLQLYSRPGPRRRYYYYLDYATSIEHSFGFEMHHPKSFGTPPPSIWYMDSLLTCWWICWLFEVPEYRRYLSPSCQWQRAIPIIILILCSRGHVTWGWRHCCVEIRESDGFRMDGLWLRQPTDLLSLDIYSEKWVPSTRFRQFSHLHPLWCMIKTLSCWLRFVKWLEVENF